MYKTKKEKLTAVICACLVCIFCSSCKSTSVYDNGRGTEEYRKTESEIRSGETELARTDTEIRRDTEELGEALSRLDRAVEESKGIESELGEILQRIRERGTIEVDRYKQ